MPKSINQNLVTGGAGFIGSNLINVLMNKGEKVICIDNFFSGRELNISKWLNHPRFIIINHDLTIPIEIKAEKIWHLACPASPFLFHRHPIETSKPNFLGTLNMLELARKNNSRTANYWIFEHIASSSLEENGQKILGFTFRAACRGTTLDPRRENHTSQQLAQHDGMVRAPPANLGRVQVGLARPEDQPESCAAAE